MTPDDLRGFRVRAQRLGARREAATVDHVLADVFALQAQDDSAATLGVWARTDGLTADVVARARFEERSVVRVWSLRGTLHFIRAGDVRWLLDLLRPVFTNANRARRAELGLDADATARGVRVVVEALGREGPLTRAEVAERLAQRGIPSAGQATIHLIWRAALDGLVCNGPERHGQETFVLLEDWLPPSAARSAQSERDAGLAELARRYLKAYGPARPDDLSFWSGLSLSDARRGWARLGQEAVEVDTPLGPMWLHASQTEWLRVSGIAAHSSQPVLRLLPAFDGLWLGYREREVLLPTHARRRVYPGGGLIRPSILLDGRPVGTWTRRTTRQGVELALDLFSEDVLSPEVLPVLEETVADLGRFLGRPVIWVQARAEK